MQLEPNDTTFSNPVHLEAITMVFLGIVVMQIANVFACRSDKHSVFKLGFFSNKFIFLGIAFELLFAASIIYIPVPAENISNNRYQLDRLGTFTDLCIIHFLCRGTQKKIATQTAESFAAGLIQE